MTVVGELARYKLDLMGVQEVRSDQAGTIRAGDYTLFYGKGNDNHQSIGDRVFRTPENITRSEESRIC
jgi:hypothetical protein